MRVLRRTSFSKSRRRVLKDSLAVIRTGSKAAVSVVSGTMVSLVDNIAV
jgi:hypothetical protein